MNANKNMNRRRFGTPGKKNLSKAELFKKEGLKKLLMTAGAGEFIQDYIEDEIPKYYNEKTLETVKSTYGMGPGFMEVADAVELALDKADTYPMFEEDEEGIPTPVFDAGFEEWYLVQTSIAAAERIRENYSLFWKSWCVTKETRKIIKRMTVLEERILFLSYGFDCDGTIRGPQEIADLPEFKGNSHFIELVLERAKNMLEENGYGEEELTELRNNYREHVLGF